jgi:SAM-dependent methyltransferase
VDAPRTPDPFRPSDFDRMDPRPDATFYDLPRFVVHIDEGAIAAVTEYARRLARPGDRVLDLMSSCRSHLPPDVPFAEVQGLGLNAEEMAANPQLTGWLVHDLNAQPDLPLPAAHFDLALCTVSVQYLTRPLEVFAAVREALRPGGAFLVTFSNRCFPTKAVRIWHEGDDRAHLLLVRRYFILSGGWDAPKAAAHTPADGDPLYAVWARRA